MLLCIWMDASDVTSRSGLITSIIDVYYVYSNKRLAVAARAAFASVWTDLCQICQLLWEVLSSDFHMPASLPTFYLWTNVFGARTLFHWLLLLYFEKSTEILVNTVCTAYTPLLFCRLTEKSTWRLLTSELRGDWLIVKFRMGYH